MPSCDRVAHKKTSVLDPDSLDSDPYPDPDILLKYGSGSGSRPKVFCDQEIFYQENVTYVNLSYKDIQAPGEASSQTENFSNNYLITTLAQKFVMVLIKIVYMCDQQQQQSFSVDTFDLTAGSETQIKTLIIFQRKKSLLRTESN